MLDSHNTDFENEDAKEVYYHMCQAFDVGFNSHDANLTYKQFLDGSTMWAWTLSPDTDANNNVALLQKPGNFEADIMSRMDTLKMLILLHCLLGSSSNLFLLAQTIKFH